MELINKVERLQNTIYSSEQANMIDKLKEKGLVSKPIFDLSYGPDRFKNRDVRLVSVECFQRRNFSK